MQKREFPANFYEALKVANISYRAMSWGGYNLFGDEKSVEHLATLVHSHSSVETFWRPSYERQQKTITELEAKVAELGKTLDECYSVLRQSDEVLRELSDAHARLRTRKP